MHTGGTDHDIHGYRPYLAAIAHRVKSEYKNGNKDKSETFINNIENKRSKEAGIMKSTLFGLVGLGRKKIWKMILPVFLLSAMVVVSMTTGMPVMAAAKTASVSGNWSNTATWGGSSVPVAGDTVTINSGITVTVDVAAACASLTFNNATSNATLTVNSGVTLTVTGAITLQNNASANTAATLAGAGTISCASISVGGTYPELSNW